MDKRYIIALDEGTTSARALLYDTCEGAVVSVINRKFNQYYPHPGWVEQDPEELFAAQYECLTDLFEKNGLAPETVYAIGVTNQRETVIVWDRATGKPVYNAIVWQCRRTADFINELKWRGLEAEVKAKTGLPLDAYFSASKIRWILDNVPQAKGLCEEGRLAAGTVDTFLINRLTNGEVFVTDTTNASRTQLFDINTMGWDDRLLDIFGVPKNMLPDVVDSSHVCGYWQYRGIKIPIAGIAGDQQAALFGQGCFLPGMAKNTYGTGCFMLMNSGTKPIKTKKLITTVAWSKDGRTTYALEGSIFNAGTVVQWLRDEMGLIKKASDTEEMCLSVPDTKGVYFVPSFTGLGAPYWDMEARGGIVGLTRDVDKNHIVRAAMESMAYNTKAIFDEMKKDSGIDLKELRCDGGVSRDNFLMQFQADMLACATAKQQSVECTAMGVIFLAGLAVGAFKSLDDIASKIKITKTYLPQMDSYDAAERYRGWQAAVKMISNN